MPEPESAGHVSRLLRQWIDGEPEAQEELWHLVYDRLKGLAQQILRDKGGGLSLAPTPR